MNDSCVANLTQTSRYAAFATLYSLILFVGLPLNGLCLWILLKKHGLTSSNLVFMANLALCDFVLALSMPLRIHYYATGKWSFGPVACTITSLLFRFNIQSSAILITFISVDRLLAVVFPLRSRTIRTPRSSGMVCIATWLFLLPLYIYMGMIHIKNVRACKGEICFDLPYNSKSDVSGKIAGLIILILLIVNILSTVMVLRSIHRSQVHSVGYSKMRIMLIFGVNVMMFVIFFMPFSIVILLRHMKITEDPNVLRWTVCYATLNCCLDPFIYYFSLDYFWKRGVEHPVDS